MCWINTPLPPRLIAGTQFIALLPQGNKIGVFLDLESLLAIEQRLACERESIHTAIGNCYTATTEAV